MLLPLGPLDFVMTWVSCVMAWGVKAQGFSALSYMSLCVMLLDFMFMCFCFIAYFTMLCFISLTSFILTSLFCSFLFVCCLLHLIFAAGFLLLTRFFWNLVLFGLRVCFCSMWLVVPERPTYIWGRCHRFLCSVLFDNQPILNWNYRLITAYFHVQK